MRARASACVGAFVLGVFTTYAHAQDWPRVALPQQLRAVDIGEQITLNALPMRVRAFVSPIGPNELAELFRDSLGKPLVESTRGSQRILGRLQGEFYISVQIEPAGGGGSRGTTAVTHLKAAFDSQEQSQLEKERWMLRLLPGSRLLSLMTSKDGARIGRHVVFANGHDERFNRDRLKSMLREDGLSFEHEGRHFNDGSTNVSGAPGASTAMFFKGADKEAMATIHRNEVGTTTVVLNVVARSTLHP